MAWRLGALLRNLLRRDAGDRELDEELRAYLDLAADAKEERGLSRGEARRRAAAEMGGLEAVKEGVRAARAGAGLESWLRDLGLAVRQLRRAPGFSAAVVATLALAIGANAAVFGVVEAVLLAPLPYREPDRLMWVWSNLDRAGYRRAPISGPELRDLRDWARSFEGFAAIWATGTQLTGDGEPEQLRVGLVTANFFSLLGAEPRTGRGFEPADEGAGASRTVVLSDGLWRRRFGGDPGVVGRAVRLNGRPVTVVGIAPPEARLFFPADASVPPDLEAFLPFDEDLAGSPRPMYYLRTIGRLKPGVSREAGAQEIAALGRRIEAAHTDYAASGRSFFAVPLQQDAVREVRPALLTVLGAVGLVLLLACVNVANLLLGRDLARRGQMALRSALGASRARLVRQVATETFVLAGLGLVVGLALGEGLLHVLFALRPAALVRFTAVELNPRVLLFTAGLGLFSAVVVSLVGLGAALRVDLASVLRGVGRSGDDAPRRRVRRLLVASEIALSSVLLIGAGLLVRSFGELQHVDPGFRADRVLTFRLGLPDPRYPDLAATVAFARRLEARLRALPGVESVGAVSALPFDDLPNWSSPYVVEGADEAARGGHEADARAVSPGFFATVGARLVRGRFFEDADDGAHRPVVVVDETLAAKAWPGRDPVGQRLQVEFLSRGEFVPTWAVVVGVVRHLQHRTLGAQVREQVYVCDRQAPRNPTAWVLRTEGEPEHLSGAVRSAVAELDAELPVYDLRPLAAYLVDAQGRTRFTTLLCGAFAAVALLLAGIGIYGVVSYSVARRRREIGVRLVLGARVAEVRGAVLRDGIALALAGLAVGLLAALVLARAAGGLLYGVSPVDPLTYGAVAVALALVAAVASWAPARRAGRLEPVEVLRSE